MQPLFTLWWNTNQDNSVFLLFLSRFMDFCTWIMSEIIHCLSVCGFTIFCTHIKKLSCCSLWIKAAGVKKQAKDIHRLQWDQRCELDCRCGGLNMSPNTFKKVFLRSEVKQLDRFSCFSLLLVQELSSHLAAEITRLCTLAKQDALPLSQGMDVYEMEVSSATAWSSRGF